MRENRGNAPASLVTHLLSLVTVFGYDDRIRKKIRKIRLDETSHMIRVVGRVSRTTEYSPPAG
jgi:hypothetical protein